MSQVRSRINLGAKIFPFLARDWGRTIIVPQYDNNFNRQTYSQEDQDKDVGIPQVYYMHNVMPTAQGLQSIGYTKVLVAAAETTFDYQYELLDDIGNSALLGICTNGKWYIRETGHDTVWRLLYTSAYPAEHVYVAYCQGVTYIWQKNTGCNSYDFKTGTHALVPVTLTALDKTTVTGITASFGYLIAWTTAAPTGGITVCNITNGSSYFVYVSGAFAQVGDVLSGTGVQVGTTVGGYHRTLSGVTSYVCSLPATATVANDNITVGTVFPGGMFWSSTIDPTDFTPSLITGAGGGLVEGARGPINFVFPHVKGLLLYCDSNIVAAPYNGNPRFPFDFQAIVGSSGAHDPELVTQEDHANQHYAYTDSGLQFVTMLQSNVVLPEVTDFVSGATFEDFDDNLLKFNLTDLSVPMVKRIKSVLNRYLVISYGQTQLTHALIYDQIMKRWGKIKFTHVQAIELDGSMFTGLDIPKDGFGFLNNIGEIWYVNFDEDLATSNGTVLLGKYQFTRARTLILDQIDIETIPTIGKFTLTVMSSLNGKDISSKIVPYVDESSNDGQIRYFCRAEGINHTMCCQGKFKLTSGVLAFSIGGKR